MREFLLENGKNIVLGIMWTEALFFVLLLQNTIKNKQMTTLMMLFICGGLLFDAYVMAWGRKLDPELLLSLSKARYIIHGLIVPLNLAVCGYVLNWTRNKKALMWLAIVIIMAGGAYAGYSKTLELKNFAGVLRYVSAKTTPEWADRVSNILSAGCVLPVVLSGVVVWKAQKSPAIFFAGLFMFGASAGAAITGNTDLMFMISMFGEVFMIFFYWLYSIRHVETVEEEFYY